MRIGIRTGLSGLVLACVFASAGTVHLAWHGVADRNSRRLAAMLSDQVAAAVQVELAARLRHAEMAFAALRTIFVESVIDSREADRREFVFLSQMQAQPSLSWVAFGWPEGAFFGAHRLGDGALEMVEVSVDGDLRQRRTDHYRLLPDGIEFRDRRFSATDFDVRAQPWFGDGSRADAPEWAFVNTHPDTKRGAIAFAGPIDVYGRRQGVLAVMIELNRLSRYLGRLDVGQSGGAFILSSDGSIVAGPDPVADEITPADFFRHPLLPLARQAGEVLRDGVAGAGARLALRASEADYAVDLAPLGFRDWQVAVIIPEREFLDMVNTATRRLGIGIAAFVLAAAVTSTLAASRLIARPLRAIAGDLARVETFELDALRHRPSRFVELDALSASLMRTANGLAAFGKYLPRDLVRTLVAEGIAPMPGGETRPLTVMFADVAGFTGLSERLGAAVVPLIGRFLEAVAGAIEAEGGTVDKFIGDAVMAFWGAPRPDGEHAFHACRAALAGMRAVRVAGLLDDHGQPLQVRIGLQSGPAVVGNVGSRARLNYTALGDTVNIASRLETTNKLFGTSIIIGEATRTEAGGRIVVRELDTIALYGRGTGTALFELLAIAEPGRAPEPWVAAYEAGLGLYRARHWAEAAERFGAAAALRGGDEPSELMLARCRELALNPPAADWMAVHAVGMK